MKVMIDTSYRSIDFVLNETSSAFWSLKIDFCFRDSGVQNVVFDNLSFSYYVRYNDEILVDGSYPESDNVGYISTDQDFLESVVIENLKPGSDYVLGVLVSNGGEEYANSISFSVPVPPKPYKSWSWDSEIADWVPPFLPPDDGIMYDWDESKQDWIIYIPQK